MLHFIPVSDVKLKDPMWLNRLSLVKDVMLPNMWDILNDRIEGAEKSHCVENFRLAAGLSAGEFHGVVFIDSDLYKWIEAVSYCLLYERDKNLEALCDSAVDLIEGAQQSDGYINTYYSLVAPEKRWQNLMEGHELYCAGHLIEAAVAYSEATGKTKILDIAKMFADHIDETFGKKNRRGYPGHPEIELALIRLYKVTEEKKYLELAKYFINERGKGKNIFEEERAAEGYEYIFPDMVHFREDYFQTHAPVREQKTAKGHAVRAMYLYSAMADLACMTNDAELESACEAIFDNIIYRQMYITGGIGSSRLGERFTTDYDLPSDSAYAETCASIGLMLFSSRMWLLNRKPACFDIWEQTLFNSVLSGMGKDGQHFFYVNPLEVVLNTVKQNPMLSHVKPSRQKWFSVACCPPNLARLLSSLPGYIYGLDEDRLYVTSHICSSFRKGGLWVNLDCKGKTYRLTVDGGPMDIFLRIPANTTCKCEDCETKQDGYFVIRHEGGSRMYEYTFIPEIHVVHAHPRVSALSGKVSVQRGLIIYCVEEADNIGPLSSLRLPADAKFIEEDVDWLPETMPVLKTQGYRISEENWDNKLYDSQACEVESCEITFIPYCQWGNRGEDDMRVWLTEKVNAEFQ